MCCKGRNSSSQRGSLHGCCVSVCLFVGGTYSVPYLEVSLNVGGHFLTIGIADDRNALGARHQVSQHLCLTNWTLGTIG